MITVPYYFNDARRKATEDAGRIAGLQRDRHHERAHRRHADLCLAARRAGGDRQGSPAATARRWSTIWAAARSTSPWSATRPPTSRCWPPTATCSLGGVDWNDRLADYVADEFKSKYREDPRDSAQTMQILRNECDVAKIDLSAKTETTITCRHNGKTITVPITREKFESLTADLLAAHRRHAASGARAGQGRPSRNSTRSCWWAARRSCRRCGG